MLFKEICFSIFSTNIHELFCFYTLLTLNYLDEYLFRNIFLFGSYPKVLTQIVYYQFSISKHYWEITNLIVFNFSSSTHLTIINDDDIEVLNTT